MPTQALPDIENPKCTEAKTVQGNRPAEGQASRVYADVVVGCFLSLPFLRTALDGKDGRRSGLSELHTALCHRCKANAPFLPIEGRVIPPKDLGHQRKQAGKPQ